MSRGTKKTAQKLREIGENVEIKRQRVEDVPMPKDGKTLDRITDGGKGDETRPFDYNKWSEGYDRIDWSKK